MSKNIHKMSNAKKCQTQAILKIAVLGSQSVGKTSILQRYTKGEFREYYEATIDPDLFCKQIDVDGINVKLQIWDTAGQERFRSIGWRVLRNSDCCVLVYDVTNVRSFLDLQMWRDEFLLNVDMMDPWDPETFPFLVLGNKVDQLEGRAVSSGHALKWCRQFNNTHHFEVSAKEDLKLDCAFLTLIGEALGRDGAIVEEILPTADSQGRIKLEEKKMAWWRKKWLCC